MSLARLRERLPLVVFVLLVVLGLMVLGFACACASGDTDTGGPTDDPPLDGGTGSRVTFGLDFTGRGIGRLKTLRKRHGGRRWRKLKGDATVRLANGTLRRAEIHRYEAHGVGKRD